MSKESDEKDAAAQDQADAFAADEAALAAEADTLDIPDDAKPAGVEDIKRNEPPIPHKLQGKYDFAPITNALNNVLNLRNVPGLDKAGLLAEFEAQLCEILDASAVTPEKWNKTIDRDSQEPGGTYAGHPQ